MGKSSSNAVLLIRFGLNICAGKCGCCLQQQERKKPNEDASYVVTDGKEEKKICPVVLKERKMYEVGKRKESKTKAGAEKQELVGVNGLTLDFLLSSELLMIGSRA